MDPLLTGDGHLRAGSPCINMGNPVPRYGGEDIDGEFRVYDRRIDLGANERRLFVRVTQEDGHQAWSSPIYLIKNR